MSKRSRRRRDQTDSKSRKLHRVARSKNEVQLGIAVFVTEAHEGADAVFRVERGIDYEAYRGIAESSIAAKWIANPVYQEHREAATRGDESLSIGRGAFGCPACTVDYGAGCVPWLKGL